MDASGAALSDPLIDAEKSAFEQDANLNFEKWDEYWRKVDGVRFLHPDVPADLNLRHLLRYDQIHRSPAGPTSGFAPPYLAPTDDLGNLHSSVIGRVSPYKRPNWDGAAYLCFSDHDGLLAMLRSERIIEKIRPEDRVMFRDLGSILSKQFVAKPSSYRSDAVTLVKTHIRVTNRSREEFQQDWLSEHRRLLERECEGYDLVRRYVQLHNIGSEVAGGAFFHAETSQYDVVSLTTFGTMADAEAFLQSELSRRIAAAENESCRQVEFWTGINFAMKNINGADCVTSTGAM